MRGLTSLRLEGRADVGGSEFLYLASLRRWAAVPGRVRPV
jgi:hypothetical protein